MKKFNFKKTLAILTVCTTIANFGNIEGVLASPNPRHSDESSNSSSPLTSPCISNNNPFSPNFQPNPNDVYFHPPFTGTPISSDTRAELVRINDQLNVPAYLEDGTPPIQIIPETKEEYDNEKDVIEALAKRVTITWQCLLAAINANGFTEEVLDRIDQNSKILEVGDLGYWHFLHGLSCKLIDETLASLYSRLEIIRDNDTEDAEESRGFLVETAQESLGEIKINAEYDIGFLREYLDSPTNEFTTQRVDEFVN